MTNPHWVTWRRRWGSASQDGAINEVVDGWTQLFILGLAQYSVDRILRLCRDWGKIVNNLELDVTEPETSGVNFVTSWTLLPLATLFWAKPSWSMLNKIPGFIHFLLNMLISRALSTKLAGNATSRLKLQVLRGGEILLKIYLSNIFWCIFSTKVSYLRYFK